MADTEDALPETAVATSALPTDALTQENRELEVLSTLPNMDLIVLQTQTEDWNYTADDHAILTGRLQYSPESEWVPSNMRGAMLTAIDAILRTSGATTGISPTDFFHGHLVLPKTGASPVLPDPIEGLKTTYQTYRGNEYNKILGDVWSVTLENIASFAAAVARTYTSAKTLLTQAVPWSGAALIFHTWENNRPSTMKAGDPLRNWRIAATGGTAEMFSPPDVENASSYLDLYDSVFQFCFLIDTNGRIYVRPFTPTTGGYDLELSTITGKIHYWDRAAVSGD